MRTLLSLSPTVLVLAVAMSSLPILSSGFQRQFVATTRPAPVRYRIKIITKSTEQSSGNYESMIPSRTSDAADLGAASASFHSLGSTTTKFNVTEESLLEAFDDLEALVQSRDGSTIASQSTATLTTTASAPESSSSPTAFENPIRNTMHEGVFNFNKIMIDTIYSLICFLYPVEGAQTQRSYARFYVLETVARIPYFAYLCVLHLRETFGERNLTDKMRTHYAEADNELHHLLIMEELGGNAQPIDRAFAHTMGFFYFWYVTMVYFWNESAAYHLSELIEAHAYRTYDDFTTNFATQLRTLPVPAIAKKYYEYDDPFLFDLVCRVRDYSSDKKKSCQEDLLHRRPKLDSLYDVFMNIRDDEKEHWKCLCNLVQYSDMNAVHASQVQATEPTNEAPL